MKRLLIASALLMAASGLAHADDNGKKNGHEQDRHQAHGEADKDYDKAVREYDKDRKKAYKEYAKAERKWVRGDHIPREYLVETYYVRDYRDYDLSPPPRGYTWVRPDPRDDDYYLVQLATGVISEIFGR